MRARATPRALRTQARGAPILAEYLGGAVTCDAYHMTDPRADGLGVSTCINLALKNSGIERDQARPPRVQGEGSACGLLTGWRCHGRVVRGSCG